MPELEKAGVLVEMMQGIECIRHQVSGVATSDHKRSTIAVHSLLVGAQPAAWCYVENYFQRAGCRIGLIVECKQDTVVYPDL